VAWRRYSGSSVRTKEQEQALSKSVLDLMTDCGVAPTPDNYELFHAFASGERPALTRVMRDLIASRRPLTPELLADVRDRGLAGARLQRTVDTVGTHAKRSLNSVLEAAAATRMQAATYNRALTAAHSMLGGRLPPERLRNLIHALDAETRTMEREIRSLERELLASARDVARLTARLEDARSGEAIDSLTGLKSRRAFDDELRHAIGDLRDEPVSVFLCAIDRLRSFTEKWGGPARDQLLRLVARNLTEMAGPLGTAARFDDEIFAVTLRQTSLSEAGALAEYIRTNLSRRRLVRKPRGERLGGVTISIGVAQFAEGEKANDFIRRATACLELACHLGCNFIISEDDPRFAQADIDAA
jgi:diguanylate cyclase